MKSNQERSNECLPPKKREIPASTISSGSAGERPLVVAQAGEGQRGENLAWLASVVSVHESREQRTGTSTSTSSSVSPSSHDADGPQYKSDYSSFSSSSSSSSSSVMSTSSHSTRGLPLGVTSLAGAYTSTLSQSGGAIQYTHLPPSVHFIAPPYAGPYAGYISPLGPPPPPPPHPTGSQRTSSSGETNTTCNSSSSSSSSTSSKLDQHHHHHHPHHQQQQQSKASDPAAQTHSTRTISSSTTSVHGPVHPHPHPHHPLGAQLVLQYSDPMAPLPGPKKEVMNGELERNRNRHGPSPNESKAAGGGGGTKGGSSATQEHQQHHYETRHHVVLPAEYATQDGTGLRTSLMLMPNSRSGGSDPVGTTDKLPSAGDKGGICAGKPVMRTPSSSSSSSSSHPFLPPLAVDGLKGAPTVIQASHATTTDALSLALPSAAASFYPGQQPIIGYIAGTAAHPGAHTQLGYHPGSLPPHLLAQPLIIPVSGTTGLDPSAGVAVTAVTSSSVAAATAHTFLAPAAVPPKGDVTFEAPAPVPFPHPQHPHHHHGGQVVQTQLHLPLVHTPAGLLASPLTPTHPPPHPPPPAVSASHTHPHTHPLPPPPSLPAYFAKGSIIQLADGELKRVEELSTEDFLQSADISADLRIDSSTVERIAASLTPNYAIIQFAVGEHRAQVSVEVLVEYPFFVFGQGWSSCSPERTTQLLELPCTKLSVGDVCISLTLKNLKNGALKKNAGAHPALENQSGTHTLPPPLKAPKAPSGGGAGGGGGVGEMENGPGRGTTRGRQANAENGEVRQGERGTPLEAEALGKPTARKRRWSAPEGRKVEKPDEEPPLAPPKASFLSQEVKLSIEGRSNMGK